MECGTLFLGIIKVIETIRSHCPQTKLYVQSLLPLNDKVGVWKLLKGKEDMIVQLNGKLKEYCDHHSLPFIDLYTPLLNVKPIGCSLNIVEMDSI